jgi:hypothetical protein
VVGGWKQAMRGPTPTLAATPAAPAAVLGGGGQRRDDGVPHPGLPPHLVCVAYRGD